MIIFYCISRHLENILCEEQCSICAKNKIEKTMNKAKEYYNTKWNFHKRNKDVDALEYRHTTNEMIEESEDYHQSRVNATSDDEIDFKFLAHPMSIAEEIRESEQFVKGIKWFKNKLLKQ